MVKSAVKMLLRFLGCFVFCFIVIYLIVFVGAWKLFESGDPILIQIGFSSILSIFLFAVNEVIISHDKKIKDLEMQVKTLENFISSK